MGKQDWRHTYHWRKTRKIVLKRDNYTCKICGGGDELDVHHIQDASYHPDLRFDIDNLDTICHKCHYVMYHILFKGGTRKKCTKKDYRKFKAIAKYYIKM